MEQVIIGGYGDPLKGNLTEYNGLAGGYNWGAGEHMKRQLVSTSGIIKNLRIRLSGPPGGGTSRYYDFTLMLNGAPTALTVHIHNTDTSGADTTNEIDVVAGDIVSLRSVPSPTLPNQDFCAWTSMFEGATSGESLILGSINNELDHTITEYSAVSGVSLASDSAPYSRQLCPTAGIIKNLYAHLNISPGTGSDAYTFTLRKNGVLTDLAATITAGNTTGNNTTDEVEVVAGDILTFVVDPTGTPSGQHWVDFGMTFVATVDGESLILGGTSNDMDDTLTEYNNLSGSRTSWTATEADRHQLGQECILKKLYVQLNGAPGVGNHYEFTLRVAGGNGNVVADITGSINNKADSGELEDAISNDDYLDLEVDPLGTPAVRYAFWGLVCYIEPPPIVAPIVTAQAATDKEDTTATTNGNITDNGGENCDKRGVVYDTETHVDPGNVAPGASGYASFAEDTDSFGEGPFTKAISGLPPGTTIYYRMYAHNSEGYDYSNTEITFLTKPAAPTSVAATDGVHTDKVVVTWVKSTGATGYKVYEGVNLLDTLGDVATFDDVAAPDPTITPGAASASDGTSPVHVVLSLAGESTSVGASRTYKVVAFNATGDSDDSDTDTGYRGVGALTYQWQRSAADSDADYGNIDGATTDPYNDTGAPGNGQGRYYQCVLSATGAPGQTSSSDRGYRWMGGKTAHMGAKMIAAKLI